jgi:aryl-alcohol dehydrogenase-like predicted oxidoreductase
VRGVAEERVRQSIVAETLDAGATVFDIWTMLGEALQVLGRRDEALIATKVWSSSVDEGRIQIQRALTYFCGQVEL